MPLPRSLAHLEMKPCFAWSRETEKAVQLGSKTSVNSLKMHQAILDLDPLWQAQEGGYVGFFPPKSAWHVPKIVQHKVLKLIL